MPRVQGGSGQSSSSLCTVGHGAEGSGWFISGAVPSRLGDGVGSDGLDLNIQVLSVDQQHWRSPWSLLEMINLGPLNQNLHLNKISSHSF